MYKLLLLCAAVVSANTHDSNLYTCIAQGNPLSLEKMACPNLIQHKFRDERLCSAHSRLRINTALHSTIDKAEGTLYVKTELISRCTSWPMNFHSVVEYKIKHILIDAHEVINVLNAVPHYDIEYPEAKCEWNFFSTNVADTSKMVIISQKKYAIINHHETFVVIEGNRYERNTARLSFEDHEYVNPHGRWIIGNHNVFNIQADLNMRTIDVNVCQNEAYDSVSGIHMFSFTGACLTNYDETLCILTREGFVLTDYVQLRSKFVGITACDSHHVMRAFNIYEAESEKLSNLYRRIIDENTCAYIKYHAIRNVTHVNEFLEKIAKTRRGMFETMSVTNNSHVQLYDCVSNPNLESGRIVNASTNVEILTSIMEFVPDDGSRDDGFVSGVRYINERDNTHMWAGLGINMHVIVEYIVVIVMVVLILYGVYILLSSMRKCRGRVSENQRYNSPNLNDTMIPLQTLRHQPLRPYQPVRGLNIPMKRYRN